MGSVVVSANFPDLSNSAQQGAYRLVRLPVGVWVDGARQQEAALRLLNGQDEEAAGDAARWPSPAARVTALLAATVIRIGALRPVGLPGARALTVLDRDVLLIALRQLLFGDRVQSTVTCPAAECGKKVDIDFRLSDLPIPEQSDAAPAYDCDLDGQRIGYRLPNGGDQEAVADGALQDPDLAGRQLLARCVENFDRLTPAQVERLRAEMERRDPQLETVFQARCPECGVDFAVAFDIQDFLLKELTDARAQLYQQVHTLAWYYHWSETEILAMPYTRRQIYLNLLSDSLSELQEAGA